MNKRVLVASPRSFCAGVVRAIDIVEKLLERDQRLARLYFDLAAVSVVDPEIRGTITQVNDGWRKVFVENACKLYGFEPPAAEALQPQRVAAAA